MARFSIRFCPLFAAVGLLACGGGAPAPAATGGQSSGASTSAGSSAVDGAWSPNLTKEQKIAYMKTKVTPRMGKVFQSVNAQHYSNFGCTTCHGPNYKDPDDFLPKLTMKDGNITAFADKPEVAKFMAEKVVPEMAAALGLAPYNPETKQGFGCGGCHRVEQGLASSK